MLNDPATRTLLGIVDASSLRHRVLTHNLMNASTPNYHRQDIAFDDIVKAIAEGKATSVSALKPQVFEDLSAPLMANGNNVQYDTELAQLSKNALMQQTALQLLNTKISLMRMAIIGRS